MSAAGVFPWLAKDRTSTGAGGGDSRLPASRATPGPRFGTRADAPTRRGPPFRRKRGTGCPTAFPTAGHR